MGKGIREEVGERDKGREKGIGYSHFANLAGHPSSACSKRSLALSSFFPPCGGRERESGKGDDAVQTRLCSVSQC